MNRTEQNENTTQARKQRIRERYRGISRDALTVIPADSTEDELEQSYKRVGVYARVSTDDPNQTSSYELQRNYYQEMVQRHENWELVKIYADEGISGTSLLHREAFKEMIQDCEKGLIDLVITKSVSRFARNVEDCIHYSRMLNSLSPPVGILFETEGIYTRRDNSEMQLSFLATLAQEESHNKSESMNRSIEMRFSRGIFLTPPPLGYDKDEDGNLVINEEEAKTIQLIFSLFEAGETTRTIAGILTELGRETKTGMTVWQAGSVGCILRNERYCGDVLARKTYTPNYLNHRSVKNRRNRPQYYQEEHHSAIISREEFIAVQYMMDSAKYGFSHTLPELTVIDKGVLKGFVQINPIWGRFTETDYLRACHSVLTDEDYLNPSILLRRRKGDLILSSYQVSRSQFVPTTRRISCSIGRNRLKFSMAAVNELKDCRYVELLFHPLYQLLLVRPSDKHNRHAVRWSQLRDGKVKGVHIPAGAFIHILYELCGWNEAYRYTVEGIVKEQEGGRVLLFYCDEPEIRIIRDNRQTTAFPEGWEDAYGEAYDFHEAKEIAMFSPDKRWDLQEPGLLSRPPDCHPIDVLAAREKSNRLYHEMKEEKECDREHDPEY